MRQWQAFSKTPPVVKTQADVNRLSKTPAEYSQCAEINRFWSIGVEELPPHGIRSSDSCKWPKVAYYCLSNNTKIPNLPSCKEKQKDKVWDLAPWSAAFVSYVFRSAGIGAKNFAYSGSHSAYIVEAIRNAKGESSKTPMFFGYPIDKASPARGDLICALRGNNASKSTFDDIPATKGFESHCDIVVSTGKDTLEAIGGNVGDTVAKTIVRINDKGRIIVDQKYFRNWLVVIKNRMPEK